MKCEDAKMLIGLPDADPRAVAMRDHLRACAACRADVDHQNNIRALLALKRYEQPPSGFSERCAANIRRELEQQAATEGAGWRLWSEHFGRAFQPLRLAAAAVLLIGLGFYGLRPATELAAPVGAPASWAQIRTESASASAPLVVATDNLPLLMAASNSGSLRMDYGPGATVPVNFEY
ncbi:MAG: hypothetical protein EPN23_02535 [Verrucomicrobia bacterium]|nr:MAG: hypothetical protein EPN23_02535 [Verrucomicrobiota bacterium]